MSDRDLYLKITVEIGGDAFIEDLGLQTEVQNDLEGLNNGLAETPKRFAWWATLENIAHKKMKDLEIELKKLDRDKKEALNRLESKLHLEFAGTGTVGDVKAKVAVHPERIKAWDTWTAQESALQTRLADAQFDYNQMKTGRESTESRKDALMEISRNMRGEMQQNLRVAPSTDEARQRMREFINRGGK